MWSAGHRHCHHRLLFDANQGAAYRMVTLSVHEGLYEHKMAGAAPVHALCIPHISVLQIANDQLERA